MKFALKRIKFGIYNLIGRGKFAFLFKGDFEKLQNFILFDKHYSRESLIANIPVDQQRIRKYFLQNVRVNSRSSSFVYEERVYFQQLSFNDRFTEGYIIDHNNKLAIVNISKTSKLNEGLFLGGNGSYNWFHWLIEILPKVMLAEGYEITTILVDDSVRKIPTMLESLKCVLPGQYDIIFLLPDQVYELSKIIYITEINKLQFNVFDNAVKNQLETIYNKDLLMQFANTIKLNCKTFKADNTPKKIYLKRKNTHRTGKNLDQVEKLLADEGFETVILENLTFKEQVRIFENAEKIVGLTGAAWANIIFCKPMTKMLIMSPDNYKDSNGFLLLAKVFSLDIEYLYYKNHNKPHYNSDFVVELKSLKSTKFLNHG